MNPKAVFTIAISLVVAGAAIAGGRIVLDKSRPASASKSVVALGQSPASARTALLVQARDVAYGLVSYASDHGDQLPPPGANLSSAIGQYLPKANEDRGFVYTYPGGTLSSIGDPAHTILGYVPGVGGRAVAYADGHSMWFDGK